MTGAIAAGVLLLGACGDDGSDDRAGDDDASASGGDAAPSGDVAAFCAAAEAVMATMESELEESSGEQGAQHLEVLRDMFQGMHELEAPDEVAEEWDRYFGSGAEVYDTLVSQLDEQDPPAGDEALSVDELDEVELEDLAAEQEDSLGPMSDPEVAAAETSVGEFLDNNCEVIF